MGHTERGFWGDLPIHVAGAHPKGRRLRAGDVGPYVVAFMDQGPIERRSLLAFDFQGKGVGCPRPRLTRAGVETLLSYDWPGNIRELRNVIERATIFTQGGALDFDLPLTGADLTPCRLEAVDEVESEYLTDAEMRRRERKNLFIVLRKTAWRIKGVDGAAELLGLRPTTLISRLEKMVLKRPG